MIKEIKNIKIYVCINIYYKYLYIKQITIFDFLYINIIILIILYFLKTNIIFI